MSFALSHSHLEEGVDIRELSTLSEFVVSAKVQINSMIILFFKFYTNISITIL